MRLGYPGLSKKDRRLGLQRDTLLADGCERVSEDRILSRETSWNALWKAFGYCREGDALVGRDSSTG